MSETDKILLERNRRQIEIAKSDPLNQWTAGEEVGHSPTNSDCVLHFIEHGGAEAFAREQQGGA